jgi:hypothetical protein
VNQPNPFGPTGRAANTCRALVASPGLALAEHLPEQQINDLVKDAGVSFRQRIFTPAVTLWTLLTQVLDPDHSCRQAVARLLAFRVSRGLPPCSADAGAYCKARARLPESVLQQLTRATGQQLAGQAPEAWLWKGRQVKVVDGTGLSMPDTPANQAAYPKQKSLPRGIGFPLLRLVVVFSLAVGTVLEAALGRFEGKGSGEVTLFRSIDDVLGPGDILLADRLYATFWDVARLRMRGVDAVMRLHAGREEINFRGRRRKGTGGPGDRQVCWRRPQRPGWMSEEEYDQYPERMFLRAVSVRVRQRGFRTRCLVVVTTLLDRAEVTREDLADLYRRRWQAELNLRSLKAVLQMDVLRGQSPEMVRKEVWAHLLVYNVVRRLMAQAACGAGIRPEEVSFTGALQTLNAFLPLVQRASGVEEVERLWRALLEAIGRHRVGDRPDRVEPRAVKRRPKNYPKLKEPRAEARRKARRGAKRSGKKR